MTEVYDPESIAIKIDGNKVEATVDPISISADNRKSQNGGLPEEMLKHAIATARNRTKQNAEILIEIVPELAKYEKKLQAICYSSFFLGYNLGVEDVSELGIGLHEAVIERHKEVVKELLSKWPASCEPRKEASDDG